MSQLKSQSYGKDNVRLVKVTAHENHQDVLQLNAQVLLSGPAFEPSYTKADNSLVVPTDTVKNTIYFLAHQHPIDSLESFGTHVISHFLSTYSHVESVSVKLDQISWDRIQTTTQKPLTRDFPGSLIPSNPQALASIAHPHSFMRGSNEKRGFQGFGRRAGPGRYTLESSGSLTGLTILKTTGSSFTDFHRCPLTTLPDMADRILSTTVDCSWKFQPKELSFFAAFPETGNKIFKLVRQLVLDLFANHDSPSVQNTLFLICQQSLALIPALDEMSVSLPNSHVFVYDLARFGIKDNAQGKGGMYFPMADPNGLINATVERIKPKL